MILPIVSFLVSVVFTSIALHHTHRLWCLPLIIIPSYVSLTTAHQLGDIGDLWAIGLAIYFVHVTSVLFFEKWVLPRPQTKRYDFAAAYKIWSNPQMLNTSRQAPGAHQVEHPPGVVRFTIVRVIRIALYILLMQLSALYIFPGPFLPLTADDFSPTKQVYFRRLLGLYNGPPVTPRETAIRTLSATYWIWTSYLTLTAAHDTLALFFTLILRLDNTADWPHLFGSPREAYTLRGFWGRFWHRLIYRPYTNYARWMAQCILRLRPGSASEKRCVVLGVFLLSGGLHAVVNWAVGMGFGGEGEGGMKDVWWYGINFAAGAVERMVILRLKGLRKDYFYLWRGSGLERVGRVVGFVWVLGFFFWSIPKREYPAVYAILS